jgi:hypothetical protein
MDNPHILKVDDYVTIKPIMSNRNLDGLQGKITRIIGEKKPFHYFVCIAPHNSVLVRGDELIMSE